MKSLALALAFFLEYPTPCLRSVSMSLAVGTSSSQKRARFWSLAHFGASTEKTIFNVTCVSLDSPSMCQIEVSDLRPGQDGDYQWEGPVEDLEVVACWHWWLEMGTWRNLCVV